MWDYAGESRLHVIEQAAKPGNAWQRIGTAHHLGQRDLRELLRTLDARGKRNDMRPKGSGGTPSSSKVCNKAVTGAVNAPANAASMSKKVSGTLGLRPTPRSLHKM